MTKSVKKAAATAATLVSKGKAAAKAPLAPVKALGQRAAIESACAAGNLPLAPDFSATTHDSWRGQILAVGALIKGQDISALESLAGDPFYQASSTRKALATWARRAAIALRASKVKAKASGAEKRLAAAIESGKADIRAAKAAAKAKAAKAAAKASAPAKAPAKAAAKGKAPLAPVKGKAAAKAPASAPAAPAKAAAQVKRGKAPAKAAAKGKARK